MRISPLPRLLAAATLTGLCGWASAIPGLQLGILGATYNTINETSIAPASSFTLYAFLTPNGGTSTAELNTLLADTYYISAAMTPAISQSATLGSFTFQNGAEPSKTVTATSDMTYGTPPLDALSTGGGTLPTHGIFPTFFKEFSFKFADSDKVTPIDVQTNPALLGLNTSATASGGYYHRFQVDVSQLTSLLHFDLYNTQVRECGNKQNTAPCDPVVYDLASQPYGFAPFSHDAQSGTTGSSSSSTSGGGGNPIPEPASLPVAVLALGLLGWQYRRRGKPAAA